MKQLGSAIKLAVAAIAMAGYSTGAVAQEASGYPERDIQIVVPFSAGGGTDTIGRAIANSLTKELGQDVIIVNRTGGGGAVGLHSVATANPDGYTLALSTVQIVTLPIAGTAPFEASDFRFIANIVVNPQVVVVAADSEYETIGDLLAAMEAEPGELNYASSSVPDRRALLLEQETGLEFTTVPYDGAAPAITDILAGQADFGVFAPGEVISQVEGGQLRPLAAMAQQPFTGFENYEAVPTLIENGVDAVEASFQGVAAPQGTPDEVVATLESALAAVAQDPEFLQLMKDSVQNVQFMDAEETEAFIKDRKEVLTRVLGSN